MKNLILIVLLLGTTSLFAQQTDLNLEKKLQSIDNNLKKQNQETVSLTQKFNTQNDKIDSVKAEINVLTNKMTGIKQTIDNNLEKQNQEITSLSKKQNLLKRQLISANAELSKLSNKLTEQNNLIDSLSKKNYDNFQNINNNSDKLGEVKNSTDTKISNLDNTVKDNRLYWIIASLLIIILGIIMYFTLGKKIKLSKTDVETQIMNTKKALDEEMINLDNKLVEVLEKQLNVIKENKTSANNNNQEKDHSLVLKIADRLTAMEMNHYRMDPKTRGLKQLKKALANIKANYKVEGYEIVEMLGMEYKEGLNVTANFIPSEEIEKGKNIITRIIKPQVNYNGKMIQAAEIEVSVGE